MKKVIDFLTELQHNNDRNWFEANKPRYKEALEEFNGVVEELIAGIGTFDPEIKGLTVKDCTYRIYRDVRFSHDKSPYKTHMGAYFCRGGKKSGFSGYYFHVEPQGEGLLGGNLLTTGAYMPESKELRSIRDEIFDNGKNFLSLVKKAKGFSLDMSNSLKRTPTGYPAGSTYDEYLRLKDCYLVQQVSNEFLMADDLVGRVTAEYKKTHAFNQLINKALEFAREEM